MNSVRFLRLSLITGDQDNYLIPRDLLNETRQLPHQLDCISDCGKALTAIERQTHDLYLIDYRLAPGEQDGLDLIARAQGLGVKTPSILLAAQRDDKLDASAMASGGLPDQGTVRQKQPEAQHSICHKSDTDCHRARQQQGGRQPVYDR